MLQVEQLDVFYGDVQALDGVSLDVEDGAIVAIVGANGAGKTTLIRALAGMNRSASGRVVFRGENILGWPSHRICNLGIGQVAEGRQIFPTLTVDENLDIGAMLPRARAGRAKNRERVLSLFPVLAERAKQAAGTLSGGEQQMLAISRALMSRPKMMLLDEPSLGLSPKLVKDIFDIILRINRERGVSVLLVEQNAHMALKTADYGYVQEVGRVVMEDRCARLLEKEDIKEFYLGMKDTSARGTRRWKKRKTWR